MQHKVKIVKWVINRLKKETVVRKEFVGLIVIILRDFGGLLPVVRLSTV